MKNILLVLLVLLLAGCGPAAQAAPTAAVRVETLEKPTTIPTPTVTRLSSTLAVQPTTTQTTTPAATATPFTGPVVVASYPMYMADNLGFPSTLLALPGAQAWETTSGGGVRVYDSATMKVLKSLDLGVKDKQFTRLVGDEQYVWALFFSPMEGPDPARLFRISRTDYSYKAVDLPGMCIYDNCLWSYLLIDKNVLWVGGYDELLGIDRDTLEPVAKFLFSEQAQVFLPAQIQDLDVLDNVQVWALFCTDVCYIVMLDRQKLLENEEQQPPKIYFENNSLQFMINLGGTMWAAEARSGEDGVQPAVLYPLSMEDIDQDMSPQDGIELPDGLDFLELSGQGYLSDGTYLWVKDAGGRRLVWFDPVQRKVVGVLQVYPGDKPTAQDPKVIMSISYDGRDLWAGGTEILRIAIPWSKP